MVKNWLSQRCINVRLPYQEDETVACRIASFLSSTNNIEFLRSETGYSIGHFVEAEILEALGVDFIDESEVLTPADGDFHINKHPFKVPFVCGCCDLGEALRRKLRLGVQIVC